MFGRGVPCCFGGFRPHFHMGVVSWAWSCRAVGDAGVVLWGTCLELLRAVGTWWRVCFISDFVAVAARIRCDCLLLKKQWSIL